MKAKRIKLLLALLVLFLAVISPNLFPAAQAGFANLSTLAIQFLIPSIILILIIVLITHLAGFEDLKQQILTGILAGIAGTIGLEVIRITGFKMGWMPGDLPKLLGVLLLDRFSMGPGFWSNVAGWSYHFWNGAAFGIIFSLLFGRSKIYHTIFYGLLIGVGFMISPATRALGIGIFGLQFKDGYQFITTVIFAHVAFGAILGWVLDQSNQKEPSIFVRLKQSFRSH